MLTPQRGHDVLHLRTGDEIQAPVGFCVRDLEEGEKPQEEGG